MNTQKTEPESSRGFTIVELLIVVVVIAILAAITIVAYSGIQGRARAASLQSTISSSVKKILIYSVDNGDAYPTTLSGIGLTSSAETNYQYSVNNATNPRTYCLTVAQSGVSYYRDSTMSNGLVGACPGQGLNGSAPIANMIVNPSFESNANGYGNNGTVAIAQSSDRAWNGTKSLKIVSTSASGANAGVYYGGPALVAGKTYVISGYVYLPQSFGSGIRACSWGAAVTTITCSSYVTAQNVWQRVSWIFQASNSANVTLYFYNGDTQPALGAIAYLDGVMFTEGSTVYNYGDGSAAGWVWDIPASANNSTSTGPAL